MKHIEYIIPFTSYLYLDSDKNINEYYIMGKRTDKSIRLHIKDNNLQQNFIDNSSKCDTYLDMNELLKNISIEELIKKNILKKRGN